jgi:putative peptide zinc metalloprotease protein
MAEPTQTFSESWYRIANQRLSLRSGVKVQRQNYRGQRWIVLENPFSNQFFRIRPSAYEFVARLRPDRTVQEVWQQCLDRFPDEAPGQEAVLRLLAQLYHANLLQYDLATDSVQLFERYRKQRQRETRGRWLNIMFMRFPLLDPDEFLDRTLPLVRKLISPIGGLIWLGVVIAAIKVAIDHLPELKDQSQSVLSPDNLFLLYAGLILGKTLHEFGHAYFCKRFGGEVHVMGIMLMIFTPIPYVDVSSSWGFRSRWQRVLVGLAGMIVEVFVAAIATFIWANTGPGVVHNLMYNMMFVASVSTVVFNINPLLRYDGYYILTDLIEMPNLYQRSMRQLRHLVERYWFGVKKSDSPAENRREVSWFVGYGVLSGIYRVIVFAGILLFVADRFLLLGLIMAAICFISWVTVPLTKLIIYLASSPQLDRNRPRAVAVVLGLVALLLLLLDIIPFPHHFRAPGVLESRNWTQVVNDTAGSVSEVTAAPGKRVTRGQELLRLVNRELDLDLAAMRASLTETQARLRQAMSEQTANLKPLESKLASVTKNLERLEADRAALSIKARTDGIWVSPQANEWVGRWVTKGTALGLIIDPAAFEFSATVVQADVDRLFNQKFPRAEVRLPGEAGSLLLVNNLRVVPAEQQNLRTAALGWGSGGPIPVAANDPDARRALEPFFEVRGDITPARGVELIHGRTGRARFDLPPEPLLPRWIRQLRQLLQKRYQI